VSTAKSRRPVAVLRSQDRINLAASPGSIGLGSELAGQQAAEGTAPANRVGVSPARYR